MHCFIVRSLLSSSALAGTVAAQRSMSTRRSPGVAHEERAKANRTKINLSIGPLSLAQRPYSGFVAWLWWRRGRGAPMPCLLAARGGVCLVPWHQPHCLKDITGWLRRPFRNTSGDCCVLYRTRSRSMRIVVLPTRLHAHPRLASKRLPWQT